MGIAYSTAYELHRWDEEHFWNLCIRAHSNLAAPLGGHRQQIDLVKLVHDEVHLVVSNTWQSCIYLNVHRLSAGPTIFSLFAVWNLKQNLVMCFVQRVSVSFGINGSWTETRNSLLYAPWKIQLNNVWPVAPEESIILKSLSLIAFHTNIIILVWACLSVCLSVCHLLSVCILYYLLFFVFNLGDQLRWAICFSGSPSLCFTLFC